ncbi:MAG TPA: hypothetical protein VH092_05445 [Urbifossiella sp.]|jgi:hypothetical protein|nr:hypothetical protein [Urbifossiella sp.]
MDDPRDNSVLAPTSPSGVWEIVAQLRSDVAALRGEVARLREDNLGLRPQVGYGKAMHAAATERVEASDRERDQLRGENRQRKADVFGRRSEARPVVDRSNDLDDPGRVVRPGPAANNHNGPARRDYSHRPAREEWVELPEADRWCPCCGRPLAGCGTEDSEQVEVRTEVYRRVIRRRRYLRTCDGPGPPTRTAPPPPKLIPKSRFGTSVRVEVRRKARALSTSFWRHPQGGLPTRSGVGPPE